ncbi:cytochrome c maturation protein CcmE [Alphaproteobacteria bacterium]|nr:cytochrome c maturation protein CcmE [Alphaproteobacteria bacterium]
MKLKTQRLFKVSLLLIIFLIGCSVLFYNLRNNLVFFFSPSEVLEKKISSLENIRLGGMVKKGSVKKKETVIGEKKVQETIFTITDFEKEIAVYYIGILPDLFSEGQGVVVEGNLINENKFNARIVLAKHDENYMPPELDNIAKPTN